MDIFKYEDCKLEIVSITGKDIFPKENEAMGL